MTRVHENLIEASHLPAPLREDAHFWNERIADIAAFEAYLGRQGTRVIKFLLNVGRDEQKERFLARLDEPDKTWKFDPADVRERKLWPLYRDAYEAAIAGTATPRAPWYIVPADRKWFTRLVVAEAIIEALESLDLRAPKISEDDASAIEDARRSLEAE